MFKFFGATNYEWHIFSHANLLKSFITFHIWSITSYALGVPVVQWFLVLQCCKCNHPDAIVNAMVIEITRTHFCGSGLELTQWFHNWISFDSSDCEYVRNVGDNIFNIFFRKQPLFQQWIKRGLFLVSTFIHINIVSVSGVSLAAHPERTKSQLCDK